MTDISQSEPVPDLPSLDYYHLTHSMIAILPPPVADTPAALRARNNAAVAKVAAMLPVNANEADLAVQCIVTRAQAVDVARAIREHTGDTKEFVRLNSLYVAMVRASQGAFGHLTRAQAVRHKREQSEPAMNADAWMQHVVARSMHQALEAGLEDAPVVSASTGVSALAGEPLLAAVVVAPAGEPLLAAVVVAPAGEPAAAVDPAPVAAQPAAALAAIRSLKPVLAVAPALAPAEPGALSLAPAFDTVCPPQPAGREPGATTGRARQPAPAAADDPPRDLAEEVEYYIAVYPGRAREIRRHGGLPPNCSFGPPDDDLVDALLASTSPLLRELDGLG